MSAFIPSFPRPLRTKRGNDGRPYSTHSPRPAESRAGFSSVTLAGSLSAVAFPRMGATPTTEPLW